MRTVQKGDRVQVHYVKRLQDGTVVSSHGRAPLELTVGVDCRRLPGFTPSCAVSAVGDAVRRKADSGTLVHRFGKS